MKLIAFTHLHVQCAFINHLYFRENLDLNTLIYTAVEHNCQWAVRLILDRGSPHLDGWYVTMVTPCMLSTLPFYLEFLLCLIYIQPRLV